jgi:hypothetical protein
MLALYLFFSGLIAFALIATLPTIIEDARERRHK